MTARSGLRNSRDSRRVDHGFGFCGWLRWSPGQYELKPAAWPLHPDGPVGRGSCRVLPVPNRTHSLSRDRGYRVRGFACPDRAVPLLKPVIARAGDIVKVSPAGIAVNGRLLPNTAPLPRDAANRPLQAWPSGIYRVRPGDCLGCIDLQPRQLRLAVHRSGRREVDSWEAQAAVATAFMSTLAAGLIGAFCWRTWWSIGFAFAVPILVGLQSRRSWAAAVTFAYFAAASWPLIRAYADVRRRLRMISGALTWIVAAVLLSLPLTVAWTKNRTAAAWRIPLAFAAGVLPPFGLIGWASPVVLCGCPFPRNGLAWPRRCDHRAGARPFGKTADLECAVVALRSLPLLLESRFRRHPSGRGPNESCSRSAGSRARTS